MACGELDELLHTCANISSNSTMTTLDYSLASMPKVIAGATVFILILPLVLFEIRPFPMGTTSAVLLGATLMVLCQVVSQSEVYEILGRQDHLTTIFLLLGMMLMAQYFERERIIDFVLKKLLKDGLSFASYIWRVCLLSALLSALFTNDASCAILTPLLLKNWQNNRQETTVELELLLLGIATSSNIGSVTTIFGNPQMALIASKTALPVYEKSELNLRTCFIYLLPAAIVVFVLNVGALILYHKIRRSKHAKSNGVAYRDAKDDKQSLELTNVTSASKKPLLIQHTNNQRTTSCPILNSQLNAQVPDARKRADTLEKIILKNNLSQAHINSETVVVIDPPQILPGADEFRPSHSRVFVVIICIALFLTMVLFLASGHPIIFDMGLVPMGAAVMIITADALINRRTALPIVRRVDWSILLMFLGIFVWMYGINTTRLPRWMWKFFGLAEADYSQPLSIIVLAIFVIVGSNIFSNVPLTIIILEQIEPCKDQLGMVLMVAWCATIAGNLTLFGSVANLIVADKSLQTVDFRLTFWRYLRFGFLTTLVFVVIGMLIIYGSLQLF